MDEQTRRIFAFQKEQETYYEGLREQQLAAGGNSPDPIAVECVEQLDPYQMDGISRDDLVALIDEGLAKIPEASRANAEFHFTTRNSYGDHYPDAFIEYTRPETPDETAERLAAYKAVHARREEADHQLYEALKAKFQD